MKLGQAVVLGLAASWNSSVTIRHDVFRERTFATVIMIVAMHPTNILAKDAPIQPVVDQSSGMTSMWCSKGARVCL